jgi:hypothetical protein
MGIKTWAIVTAVAIAVVGGSAVAYANPLATPTARHFVLHDQPISAADSPTSPEALADATATSQVNAAEALAAEEAAAAAQAAVDAANAAAAQAAADAAAKAAAAVKAPVRQRAAAGATWEPGHAPAGTPIPTFIVTDPNAGNYGQRDIVDPATFCDSQSGNGDIDHAVCA